MSIGRRAYDILRSYVGNEWERIQGVDAAEQELREATQMPTPAPTVPRPADLPPADKKEHARRLLGVGAEADFDEIKRAFDRLTQRADPKNFVAGTPEARQAEEIHRRVHWAFEVLVEGVDLTERRFRSLEID